MTTPAVIVLFADSALKLTVCADCLASEIQAAVNVALVAPIPAGVTVECDGGGDRLCNQLAVFIVTSWHVPAKPTMRSAVALLETVLDAQPVLDPDNARVSLIDRASDAIDAEQQSRLVAKYLRGAFYGKRA